MISNKNPPRPTRQGAALRKVAAESFKGRLNLMPLPYRSVSLQPYDGAMNEAAINRHFLGREAYRRTDFVVLHSGAWQCAVAAIRRAAKQPVNSQEEPLFSRIVAVEVLALPDRCRFIRDPTIDVANPSAMAALAAQQGVGPDSTLVVWGKYDHVNFMHCPEPAVVYVVEVAPPEPPKLFAMAQEVLNCAEMPPIRLMLERIDLGELCRATAATAYLFPCRSGGLDGLGLPVYFLDERPPKRDDWTLVGCERSRQFYRHYYEGEPSCVEICPRRLMGPRTKPTLVKCCLLEFGIESDGATVTVPWGADRGMVEDALRRLSLREGRHA